MKVTVFGGTGYVGGYLIDELLDKGHHPVLLVRPGSRHKVRHPDRCTLVDVLQDDFTDLSSQVPWLGDIPILGSLFRSANYRRDQSELVVIITPHLVAPTRGEALALPTDRVRPPTEAELFLFGQTARPSGAPMSGAAAEVAKQDFTGSYGYVME